MELMRANPFHIQIRHTDYGFKPNGGDLLKRLDNEGIKFARIIKRRTKKIVPTYIYMFRTQAMAERFVDYLNENYIGGM